MAAKEQSADDSACSDENKERENCRKPKEMTEQKEEKK